MKLTVLKKRLLKELAISGAILGVCGAGLFFLLKDKSELEEKTNRIHSESIRLNRDVAGSETEYENFVQARKIYNKIPVHKLPTEDGLSSYPARIRAATPLIQSLAKRYNIKLMEIKISPPIPGDEKKSDKLISITTGEISISCSAPTDELIYSFVFSLMKEFTGFIKIKKFKLDREGDVRRSDLVNIKRRNELPALVKARMELSWKTLQEKPDEPENTEGTR